MRALAAFWISMSMAAPPIDPPIVLTSSPVSRELILPELLRAGDHYSLRVVGITVAPGNPALFRVFVDLPRTSGSPRADSEHQFGQSVGQVSILAGPSTASRNVIMPLVWPQQRKLSPGSKLRFTLVPLDAKAATPIRVQKIEITITHS